MRRPQTASLSETTTVVLVGAGAVEGAWAPVLRALRATISSGLADDLDVGNIQMARLIHLLRFVYARNLETMSELRDGLLELRMAIAEQLRDATDRQELRVRPAFIETVLSLHKPPHPRIVTTNWDLTLDRALASITPPLEVPASPRVS